MVVASGARLSSARPQNHQSRWWWAWWSSSNRRWRRSSPRNGRRPQRRHIRCWCRTADPPGPYCPWTPRSSAGPDRPWLGAGGNGQKCWSSPPGSGTWPASEESPGLRKTCRRLCQHQYEEQRGRNLQSHIMTRIMWTKELVRLSGTFNIEITFRYFTKRYSHTVYAVFLF